MMDRCTVCDTDLRVGDHRSFCRDCLAAISPRTQVRTALWRDHTWKAWALFNSWEIDEGPAGDSARRSRPA